MADWLLIFYLLPGEEQAVDSSPNVLQCNNLEPVLNEMSTTLEFGGRVMNRNFMVLFENYIIG